MELAFYLSSFITVLAALCVITHSQPVYALLYLIILLLAISCVFFSLGAYFAGALEIIIYAGAIMVLFVFVAIMLNMGVDHDKQEYSLLRPRNWIGPLLLSLVLLVALVHAIADDMGDHSIRGEVIAVKIVGIALFGPYILVVELASMLLLAGLVISFHLGRNRHKNVNMIYKRQNITANAIKEIGEE